MSGTQEQPKFEAEELEAIRRFGLGEPFSVSEFIDEDTIIAGYGSLRVDFEFPLPVTYIKHLFGTTSWAEWHKELKRKTSIITS